MIMASRFRLTSAISDADKIDQALKKYYKSWRSLNQKSKSSFTAIDNAFFSQKILRDLDPGPLRLYLFLANAANNDYGHSWHSISSMADYFNTQTRTIDNWIKGLVDKDLIYRTQKGHKSHNTYLIPFSTTLVHHPAPKKRLKDDQGLLDDLLEEIQDLNFIYGEVIKIHHLFQWIIRKEKSVDRTQSIQMLLIITRRSNGVLIGHLHTLRKSEKLSVSELNIEDQCIFDSPFKFNNSHVIGLALTPNPSLRANSTIKDIIELVAELAEMEEWQLQDRDKLDYGYKEDVLPAIKNEDIEENDEIVPEKNNDE